MENIIPRPITEYIRIYSSQVQASRKYDASGEFSVILSQKFGWQVVSGSYLGEDARLIKNLPNTTIRHCWNVLADGTIVDPMANQFSLKETMPRIVPIDDPRQKWYKQKKLITIQK